MSTKSKKVCLSPFVAVTYLAVSVTGVMLLMHMKYPGVYPVHKWGGILFVVAGIIHLLLNWRAFASYCKSLPGVAGLLAGVVMMLIIATAIPSDKPRGFGHGRYGDAARFGSSYHRGY